jgi:hypothetical protein
MIDDDAVNRHLSMAHLAEAFAPERMSAAGRRARMDMLALRMTRPSPYRTTPPQRRSERRAVTAAAGGWRGHVRGVCPVPGCGGHHQSSGWPCLCAECKLPRRGVTR